METVSKFAPLAFILMVIGGLNWGVVGLFDTNVLAEVFGTGTLVDVVYVVIGVAALLSLPKVFETFEEMGGRSAHPHGA